MWRGAASEGHRMRHKVFTTLSALSLLLCIATATIWATGWRFPWPVRPLMGRWAYILVVDRGYVFLEFFHFAPTPVVGPPLGPGNTETPAIVAWRKQFGAFAQFERLGFRLGRMPEAGGDRAGNATNDGVTWWLQTPYWAITIVSGGLPLIAWSIQGRRRRRNLRLRRGLCLTCGYDLRATPDRCPECGAVPQAKATA
jgi:hypothetical protein